MPPSDKQRLNSNGSNPDWIISYYQRVGSLLLPYLHNRQISLARTSGGDCFFHHHRSELPANVLAGLTPATERGIACPDERTLKTLLSCGCFGFVISSHRIGGEADWQGWHIPASGRDARDQALELSGELEKMGLPVFIKTAGEGGFDVVTRLPQAEALAKVMQRFQNTTDSGIFAPYSIIMGRGWEVPMPVTVEELEGGVRSFPVSEAVFGRRLDQHGDLWKDLLTE